MSTDSATESGIHYAKFNPHASQRVVRIVAEDSDHNTPDEVEAFIDAFNWYIDEQTDVGKE